jgi:hypothetical protein
LVACLAYSWTLKEGVVHSSETSQNFIGLDGVMSHEIVRNFSVVINLSVLFREISLIVVRIFKTYTRKYSLWAECGVLYIAVYGAYCYQYVLKT